MNSTVIRLPVENDIVSSLKAAQKRYLWLPAPDAAEERGYLLSVSADTPCPYSRLWVAS